MSREITQVEVSINSLPTCIMANPKITKLLLGGAGQGKSSVLKNLEKRYGDKYRYIYIDAPTEKVEDSGLTIPNKEKQKLETWLNARYKFDKPMIIMIDEVLKCQKSVRLIFTRLMQEHNLMGRDLPEGSVVFGTSNRTTDGLGDFIEQHFGNRMMILNVRNVNPKELIAYGTENNWDAKCLAFILHKPEVLADYRDPDQKNNPYIINPKHPNQQACTPRSLERAFEVYVNREAYKDEWQPVGEKDFNLRASIGGLCGMPFANDFLVFMKVADGVITPDVIIADPLKAPIPSDPMVQYMQCLSCVQFAKDESIENANKFWTYIKRFDEQITTTFTFSLLHVNKKLTKSLRGFDVWTSENSDLIFG
tara:strand:- start:1116 stop:2210 length:1095 start_codon:yes stop_codon:yes gene_type:complete